MEPKPPYMSMPAPEPPQPKVMRHRKWIVHSHDASRPAHVESKSDINITPLIDVMLVLLIIFMVVTPLAQKGLDIALPQPPPPNQANLPPPIGQVVLSVEESPSGPLISVNKTPVSNMEELDQKLKDIFQTKSDKTIFVRATGKVPYGKVVEAMDVARGAGVERVGIISEKMVEDAGGQ
ncbi:MAG TPA: biopolymer transporter ExbD [Vicinamibacteria bacterium]|nr:biopolymer transporter ExbD [Vicinamibacteria bacterium]